MGRKVRRAFFKKTQITNKANFVALAHHAQDQEETFFIRLLRGSTLDGLTCIKEKDGDYIRPLLNISRETIIGYLNENKIDYRVDPSNESEEFLRNRIRKHVIPALNSADKRFTQKFKDTLKSLCEENKLIHDLVLSSLSTVFVKKEAVFVGNRSNLIKFSPALQQRIILHWLKQEKVPFSTSKSFLKEILKFISSSSGGSHNLSKLWKIEKNKGHFWIET